MTAGIFINRRRGAFTLVELLVVAAIIALLLAMTLPALAKAREATRIATCAAGLKQWGMALQMYLNEHDRLLPREGSASAYTLDGTWYNELPRYANARPYKLLYTGVSVGSEGGYPNDWIWYCPTRIDQDRKNSGSGLNAFHYGMNALLNGSSPNFLPESGEHHVDTRRIDNPAQTIFLGEAQNMPFVTPSLTGSNSVDRRRHLGRKTNLLFIDGRVRSMEEHEIPYPHQVGITWQSDEPKLIWGPFGN